MCRWGVSSSDLFLCLPFFDVLVYVQNESRLLDSEVTPESNLRGDQPPFVAGYANEGIVEPINLAPVRKL